MPPSNANASPNVVTSQMNVLTIGRGATGDLGTDGQPVTSKKAARAAARATKGASTSAKSPTTSRSSKSSKLASSNTDDTPDGGQSQSQTDDVEITAYSQQSRFHRETFDANTTDIDIKGVNISVGNKDILVDAHLRFKTGVKYGMVGQNGVGKSVLMSVLGNNLLIGLPQNVRFLHVAQLEEFVVGRTILQEVLEADVERTRVIREAKALQNTANSTASSLNLVIHDILVQRSQDSLVLAQKIATKRSGQRGYIARQKLLEHEASHASLVETDPQAYVTTEMANEVMKDVFARYETVDAEGDEARARAILRGVGFADEEVGRGVDEVDGAELGKSGGQTVKSKELAVLSGGWKMRVVLAKALFMKPDVLLLDEPTNHLDLPAIMWLTHHLTSSELSDPNQTVVIVSHDRNFLSEVTTETIIFKDRKLQYHNGNYEDWESNTEEQRKRKIRLKELEAKRKKQIMASIQKNIQQAKATGDDKRLGMVASRKKALDRLGMQRLEDGKRHKISYHGDRQEIVIEEGFKTAPITLPKPFEVPFHSNAILQLSDVSFKYPVAPGSRSAKPKLIIDNVSLDVSPHARIALLGPNGCGKSTLMNLLAGELEPSTGEVRKHHRLRIGYFSQHTVDQLQLDETPLTSLRAMYPDVSISDQQARVQFANVGVQGNVVLQKIRSLSGGQRNRVALGLITFCEPHVLLLDEITNHLDVGTVESVVDAVCGFEGAVVVVSHDVWFLKQVVEGGGREEAGEEQGDEEDGEGGEEKGVVYVVSPKSRYGGLVRWEKGLDAYVEREKRRAEKLARADAKVG
ncbi:P-loop containing nucleoside triphosphate hydrolase protein [Coprinopsis marcescibilis]|uniref:P-loop containing nucleoside triphosphate hydrolase protein n=1 Tax=Coprinopsis marcescibilis TaxID=230819 RepID=A0A5C3KIG4_COPMA|nr:P-loop containing nucleoside triphosphate hydrolase protein [Coprinopsis marcescibilis]